MTNERITARERHRLATEKPQPVVGQEDGVATARPTRADPRSSLAIVKEALEREAREGEDKSLWETLLAARTGPRIPTLLKGPGDVTSYDPGELERSLLNPLGGLGLEDFSPDPSLAGIDSRTIDPSEQVGVGPIRTEGTRLRIPTIEHREIAARESILEAERQFEEQFAILPPAYQQSLTMHFANLEKMSDPLDSLADISATINSTEGQILADRAFLPRKLLAMLPGRIGSQLDIPPIDFAVKRQYSEAFDTIASRYSIEQFLLQFLHALPPMWASGAVDSVEDAIAEFLSDDDTGVVRDFINNHLNPAQELELETMFDMVSNNIPRSFSELGTEDPIFQDLYEQYTQKPTAQLIGISNHTSREIVKFLQTRALPPDLPSGMTDNQFLELIRGFIDDPEAEARIQSAEARYKQLGSAYVSSRIAMGAYQQQLVDPNVLHLGIRDHLKILVKQPALQMVEWISWYTDNISDPMISAQLSGAGTGVPLAPATFAAQAGAGTWAATRNPGLTAIGAAIGLGTGVALTISYRGEFSQNYDRLRAEGNGIWKAHGMAFQEWDTNWSVKLLAEFSGDPLALFGLGVYGKGFRLVPYIGRSDIIGRLERGSNQMIDSVFLGLYKGINKLPITPRQAGDRAALNLIEGVYLGSKRVEEFGLPDGTLSGIGPQASMIRLIDVKYMRAYGEYVYDLAVRSPASHSNLTDDAAVGRQLLDAARKYLTDDDIARDMGSIILLGKKLPRGTQILSERAAGDLKLLPGAAARFISTEQAIMINRVLADVVQQGTSLTNDEAAAMIAGILNANTARGIKEALKIVQRYRRGIRKDALRPFQQLDTDAIMDALKIQTIDNYMWNVTSPAWDAYYQRGLLTKWQRGLASTQGKFPFNTAGHINKAILYPFARLYLMFLNFGPFNVLESKIRLINAGMPIWTSSHERKEMIDRLYLMMGDLKDAPAYMRGTDFRRKVLIGPIADPTASAGRSILERDISIDAANGIIPFVTQSSPDAIAQYVPFIGKRIAGVVERKLPKSLQSMQDFNMMFNKMAIDDQLFYMLRQYQIMLDGRAPHLTAQIRAAVGDIPPELRDSLGSEMSDTLQLNISEVSLRGPDQLELMAMSMDSMVDYNLLNRTEAVLADHPWFDQPFAERFIQSVRIGETNLQSLDDAIPRLHAMLIDTNMVYKANFIADQMDIVIDGLIASSPKTSEEVILMIGQLSLIREGVVMDLHNLSRAATLRVQRVRDIAGKRQYHSNANNAMDSLSDRLETRIQDLNEDIMAKMKGSENDITRLTIEQQVLFRRRMELDIAMVRHLTGSDGPRAAVARRHQEYFLNNKGTFDQSTNMVNAAWDTFIERATAIKNEQYIIDRSLGRIDGDTSIIDAIREPIMGTLGSTDIAYMYGGTISDMIANLMDATTMTMLKTREAFILEHMARATHNAKLLGKEASSFGFTEDSIGNVYDDIMRGLNFDTPTAFDEPLQDALETLRKDMYGVFFSSGMDESVLGQYNRHIQNVANRLRKTDAYNGYEEITHELVPDERLAGTAVVDENGELLKVYHGTLRAFEEFSPALADPLALLGPGFYHSTNRKIGSKYSLQEDLDFTRTVRSETIESSEVKAIINSITDDPTVIENLLFSQVAGREAIPNPITNVPRISASQIPGIDEKNLDELLESFKKNFADIEEGSTLIIEDVDFFLTPDFSVSPGGRAADQFPISNLGAEIQGVITKPTARNVRVAYLNIQKPYRVNLTTRSETTETFGVGFRHEAEEEFAPPEGVIPTAESFPPSNAIDKLEEGGFTPDIESNREFWTTEDDAIEWAESLKSGGHDQASENQISAITPDSVKISGPTPDSIDWVVTWDSRRIKVGSTVDLTDGSQARVSRTQGRQTGPAGQPAPNVNFDITRSTPTPGTAEDAQQVLDDLISYVNSDDFIPPKIQPGNTFATGEARPASIEEQIARAKELIVKDMQAYFKFEHYDQLFGGAAQTTTENITIAPLARVYDGISSGISAAMRENIDLTGLGASDILRGAGFDGLTYQGGVITKGDPHDVWVAFHPEQIHDPFGKRVTTSRRVPGNTAEWNESRNLAAGDAQRQADLDFPSYSNDTSFNAGLQQIFPYFNYEFQRWPWLARFGLGRPGLTLAGGRYLDETDGGYVHIPGTNLEINPLRGTIFMGGLRRLYKADYPEYADQFGIAAEVMDEFSRRGFYPGATIGIPQALFGAASRKAMPQFGEILPPFIRTPLEMLIAFAPGEDFTRVLQEKIFPDRFRDFRIATIVAEEEFGGLNGQRILLKIREGQEIGDEESAAWNKASRHVAKISGGLDTQFGLFRMRGQDRIEALQALREATEALTGVSVKDQKTIANRFGATGVRLSDLVPLDPADRFLLRELLERYENHLQQNTAPLVPSLLGDIQFATIEYYDGIEDIFTDARIEGFFDDDSITGEPVLTDRPTDIIWSEFQAGIIDGVNYKREVSSTLRRAVISANALGKIGRFAQVPKTRNERERFYQEHNLPMPTWSAGQELLWEYYNISPELRFNPETGTTEPDYDTFYGTIDLLLDSVGPVYNPRLIGRIQADWNEGQILHWNDSRDYLHAYQNVSDLVFSNLPEDQKRIVTQFRSAPGAAEAQALRAITDDAGLAVVSQYLSTVSQVRENLRLSNPLLDARLLFWGETQGALTQAAQKEYNQLVTRYRPGVQKLGVALPQ